MIVICNCATVFCAESVLRNKMSDSDHDIGEGPVGCQVARKAWKFWKESSNNYNSGKLHQPHGVLGNCPFQDRRSDSSEFLYRSSHMEDPRCQVASGLGTGQAGRLENDGGAGAHVQEPAFTLAGAHQNLTTTLSELGSSWDSPKAVAKISCKVVRISWISWI